MDGAQVGVFEQVYHECLGGFLEGLYGLALPAQGVAVDGEEGETDFANLESMLTGKSHVDVMVKRNSQGGKRGVSEVAGRLSAGNGGFLGGPPCRVCSGGACGWHLRL